MVTLLSCFTKLEDVQKFHSQVADPEYYDTLMMLGNDGSRLYALVPKSALKELGEDR